MTATATIKNWGQFQHYKDRSPPWIKLHRGLLDDFDYSSLPLASKALAPLLWLLAAESVEGSVCIDPNWLAFRLRWTAKDVASGLTPLIDKGLLIAASGALAERYHPAIPETETEVETKKEKTTARPRGSRLPDDWEPTAGDADFARSIGADPSAIAPSFRDYWHGAAGAKAIKLDWSATWRNWCRRDTPKARPAPPAATNTTLGVSPKREETPQTKLQGAISYAEGMINMGVWDKAKAREYVAEQKSKLGVQ